MSCIVKKENKNLEGSILLPASKSISNRVLLIRALCKEKFEIKNLSESADSQLLNELLFKISSHSSFTKPLILDCKDAGTVARFLTTYVALLKKGHYIITGNERMQQRPMNDLIESLIAIGANVSCLKNDGFLPLMIQPTHDLKSIVYLNCSKSSQFLSSFLLVAPLLPNGLTINHNNNMVSKPYIDMTISLMAFFGVEVLIKNNCFIVPPQSYTPDNIAIEADWSAVAFWYQMAAYSENVNLKIIGLNSNSIQGDSILVDIYKQFGVITHFEPNGVLLTKEKHPIDYFEYDFINTPDIFPSVALTCAFLNIPSKLTGIVNLKDKESDRILAIVNELKKIGIGTIINSENNCLSFIGNEVSSFPENIVLRTYQDHRIAMAFASCAAFTGRICIDDSKVVSKSYPDFWKHIKEMGFVINK